MQNVLAQIRKHGNSGKHLSGGERSMLSGFQEAAQAIEDKDENALVPFCLFYNTVHTFLESAIRRVIDRCQTAADNHDGIEQYDVSVLKLLYLIRYVDDIKANVDNITTLMVDDIRADKITMRKQIQECLDRLVHENYIARNGDTYTFLTDDEQDIERDIRNTPVDSAAIVQSIATIVFGDLYVSKKFKYGKYDFSYDQIIDDTAIGQLTGAIRLRILTVASDLYTAPDQMLLMKSNVDNEVILVLSDKYPSYPDVRDNWLLDIELYSEEFRADLLSIRMQELGMSPTSQMRKAMKSYSKFFDNKERVARLSAFHSTYTNVGQLHIDILAVLAGTSANTAPGVIRAILMAGMDIESNEAITNIRKFGNEAVLWEMINRYTGYVHLIEQKSLIAL